MNIQDREKSLTAEELRRRYNLDGLSNDRKSIQLIKNSINKVEIEFQNYIDIVNKSLGEYQDQVEITTWFSNDYPTFETPEDHLGDLYYDRENGKAYKYIYDEDNTEYIWQEIEISKQVETLAIENSKADTSDDKRIVFVETPTTPYTIGDVLIKNGTYYRCRAARESGQYSMNDWIIYTDYTEDMVMLDTRAAINQLQTNVETNYVSTTQLETNTQGIYATVSETYETITNVSNINDDLQATKRTVSETSTSLAVEKGKITTLIREVGDRTGKTSSLTEEVDVIKGEISDIADITKSVERFDAYIPDTEFQDIAASNPINITIHPVGENISYLYPNTGLFPSSTAYLKVRTLRFTNTSTNENFDYILPEDLLYYDANVYDTLTIDYENAKIRVLKKCTYNADGTVSTITPEEHNYDNTFSDFEQNLSLTQGDYEVSILGYSVGYIYVRLMALNAYTAQYATKVELHSAITQTSEYVDIEVDKKVGKNEVISRINLTPETATISASKINIQGVLTAINNDTTTTIDGDKLTTGTITADKIEAKTITASQIADSTITNSKIVDATIEGAKIKDATITSAKISSLDASKITTGTLTSRAIDNGNGTFSVSTSGVLTAKSGTVGGWTLGTNRLESGSGSSYVRIDSNPNVNTAIWCGANSSTDAPFRITKAGKLTATDANITGTITATSGSFTGEVHATSGSFTGRISSTSGSIAGWTINSTYLSYGGDGGNNGARLYRDGRIYMKSNNGWLNCGSGGAILNGNRVVISDQIGTSGQVDSNTSISLRAFYGHLHLNSSVAVYANNTLLASGSSKNMKTNIKVMTEKDKQEIFKEVKELPLYTYDYKKKYSGQKNNYGIIIEDFEDKLLGKVLHVVSSNEDKNIKNFSHDDLNKVNLIVIKQLIDKIESLENKVNKLEG